MGCCDRVLAWDVSFSVRDSSKGHTGRRVVFDKQAMIPTALMSGGSESHFQGIKYCRAVIMIIFGSTNSQREVCFRDDFQPSLLR